MQKTIKGRIAGEIVITKTTNGNQVANFRIAENKAFHNRKSHRRQRVTNWFQMKAWNTVATSIERKLQIGDLVEFKVDVKPNAWTTKGGETKSELVLTVNRYRFIRKSRRNAEN